MSKLRWRRKLEKTWWINGWTWNWHSEYEPSCERTNDSLISCWMLIELIWYLSLLRRARRGNCMVLCSAFFLFIVYIRNAKINFGNMASQGIIISIKLQKGKGLAGIQSICFFTLLKPTKPFAFDWRLMTYNLKLHTIYDFINVLFAKETAEYHKGKKGEIS